MITVTPSAARQIQLAAVDSGAGGMALRIAAHFDEQAQETQYGIGFDEARDNDEQLEIQGINLLVSPLSKNAVAHLTLDYVEIEPGDFRFVFMHPESNELPPQKNSCGGCSCGSGGCGPKA